MGKKESNKDESLFYHKGREERLQALVVPWEARRSHMDQTAEKDTSRVERGAAVQG